MKKIIQFTFIMFLSLVFMGGLNAQLNAQHTVTGTVIDSVTEDYLPGVNIVVKGISASTGTVTDSNGVYEIITPSPTDTLIFSYIGYRSKEVAVEGRETIDVSLEYDVVSGEEVVVIGYGEQTKESVLGAISSVGDVKLERATVGNDLRTGLQGAAPGLTIFTTNAKPGETETVMQIRAATSMGNNTPLLVVDGVQEEDISNIDPIEIESISVLKGASATAVYGVKAANGVIIIKTKRGRAGEINLNFSTETSIKEPTRTPDFMNAYETLTLRNEGYRNDQLWDRIISDEVLEHYRVQDMPYIYPSFDWQEFYWQPAVDQKYNLNASGGSDFVRFFASVSYLNEGDVLNTGPSDVFPYEMDNDYWSKRYNFRNNLDFNLTEGTRFSVQLSGNVNKWNSPLDYYTQEMMFEPVTSMPFYPADALEKYPDPYIPYNQNGPRPFNDPTQGETRMSWSGGAGVLQRKSTDFNANLLLDQNLDFITQGLQATLQYAYQNSNSYGAENWLPNFYGYQLQPDFTWMRYDRWGEVNPNTPQPELDIQPTLGLWGIDRSFYYNAQLDYKQNFENHNISMTGVFNRRKSQGGAVFPSYDESWAARGTYNYQSRYFLEASVSYTGSEKFAPGYRFGTFPSFGLGWMVSNESFFSDALPWFNHLKIRYEWGEIGSDSGIGRWLYRPTTFSTAGSVAFGTANQNYTILEEGDVPVPDATWETATKQGIGIETGFFDNQVTLVVDLYDEQRKDILMSRNSIPTWFGVNSIGDNLGQTKAHGIEVELGLNTTLDSGLNLFMDVNASVYETRVVNWDELASVPSHLATEGKPVGIGGRTVQVMGFYQDFDELFMWPVSGGTPIVGDHKYLDYNADGVISNENDGIVPKYPFTPTANWNTNLGFNYRNWTFQASFYGISNNNFQVRGGGMWYLYPFAQSKNTALTKHGDSWSPGNRNAFFPATHYQAEGHWNQRSSSFSVLNAQYLRLKRAFITYRLQSVGLSNIGVDNIELTLTGTNLWTWTKMPYGGDPEGGNYAGQDFGAYPIQRRFSLRARMSF